MSRKRRCEKCGDDISNRPAHHYLCYSCWSSKLDDDDSNDYSIPIHSNEDNSYSEERLRRIQEENGLSDEDMANGAWIDF